jgi:hypothetical protein
VAVGFGDRRPSASVPGVIEKTEIHELGAGERTDGWIVTVFDNEQNTYEEVVTILMIATHCGVDEAFIETWEIDHLGKSVVHTGSREACATVAQIIGTIGIKVEVSQE